MQSFKFWFHFLEKLCGVTFIGDLYRVWTAQVTWHYFNHHNSRTNNFQTMFLIWSFISMKFPFQRYIIWPYLRRKKINFLYDVTSGQLVQWRHFRTWMKNTLSIKMISMVTCINITNKKVIRQLVRLLLKFPRLL